MSGAFGWHTHTHTSADDDSRGSSYVSPGGYFGQNANATPAPVKTIGNTSPPALAKSAVQPPRRTLATAPVARLPVPDARHEVKSQAEVVIIVSQDVTGSMGEWPDEIFRRLPLLHKEACEYFGTQSLEILFIAHGDARTDNCALQVARFGAGPELDGILASFDRNCGGGGQATESHELVAYYLLKRTDVTSARQVYAFFLTDEAACADVSPRLVRQEMSVDADPAFADTQTLFGALRKRMNVYTVLCETNNYDPREVRGIKSFWVKTLGTENVLPLNDSKRVVDVMLGVFAKTTDQMDRFSRNLGSRQAGSQYANQNIGTVMKSIALVGGGASRLALPKGKGTRPLLPPPADSKKT